tara:strand:+ start:348 stop:482 length:135 start_codon:yes stop_codon:yes gene_type:complete
MKTILKNNEINTKESIIGNRFLIKTSSYLSPDKWFKGSRSRGIR